MFSEQSVPALSRSVLEIQVLKPNQDLLNSYLWEWGPEICVRTSSIGGPDASSGWRNTVLEDSETGYLPNSLVSSPAAD